MTFVQRYLDGKASPEDIDDDIGLWHEGENNGELHDFLGLSIEEYAEWLMHPSKLRHILEKRRQP